MGLKLIGKTDIGKCNLRGQIRLKIIHTTPIKSGRQGEMAAENDAEGRPERNPPFLLLCQIERTSQLEIDKDSRGLHDERFPDIQEKGQHHISCIDTLMVDTEVLPPRIGTVKHRHSLVQTRLEGSSESYEPAFPETIALRGGQGGIRIRLDQAPQLDIPGIPPVIKWELVLGRQGQGDKGEDDGKEDSFHGLFLLQLDIGLDLEGTAVPTVVALLGPLDLRGGFGRCVFSAVFLSVDVLEDNLDVIGTLKYGPD